MLNLTELLGMTMETLPDYPALRSAVAGAGVMELAQLYHDGYFPGLGRHWQAGKLRAAAYKVLAGRRACARQCAAILAPLS